MNDNFIVDAAFEPCSGYTDVTLPTRATACAAGYDFYVAEDRIIQPYDEVGAHILFSVSNVEQTYPCTIHTLDEMANLTKLAGTRPALVPTGVKCRLPENYYLELSVRSSCPFKYWLVLANGVGIIDADYYNNPDNEGEIFFQVINLSPVPIKLQKGDRIGQGIIKPYFITKNDKACGDRVGGFGSTGNA